ncbi:MAG: glycosyltransferase family 39 protein [Lewinellaceae bacterium]|nr:glycosyltransferase family 39 protein [Saprospiraceae bacterium]MCB9332124.1 glycosyltransferase family 39 protein [Lewinellaceae bacterium]
MKNYSRLSFFFCATVIVLAAFWYYPKWKQPYTEATISWDVSGYYLYLPAVFIYGDLKELAFADSMLTKYGYGAEVGAIRHPNGNRVIKYSSGQALQFLPWFLLGHLGAKAFGYPPDGFSLPYQFAISMGSLLIALLGLWFLRSILLRYFSDQVVAVVLLLITLGTNYLEYSAFHSALTHNWLFTLYTLLLYCTIRFYKKPDWFFAAATGLLVGWATLTRPTDIVSALIPLAWGLDSRAAIRERLKLWRQHLPKLALAAVLAMAVGFIQMAYWKYVSGEWLVYSYQDQGFSWLRPHVLNGLFSYRAGWLIYSPVMVFAVLGFLPLAKQQRPLVWPILAFCLLYAYITFAWDIWWYGGSVGQRALIQSYPVWAFPLAAFVQWLFGQKQVFRVAGATLAVLCAVYNLWLTHQAHRGGLFKAGEMTKAYFWKILGKMEVEDDALKLLDTKREFTGTRTQVRVLYSNDFESDTLPCPSTPIEGANSLFINGERQYSPAFELKPPGGDAQWLRVCATFHAPQKEWEIWRMPQLTVRYSNGETVVQEDMIRLGRLLPNDGATRVIFLDSRLPQKAYERITVFFWNANSAKTLLIDNLTIEAFSEK